MIRRGSTDIPLQFRSSNSSVECSLDMGEVAGPTPARSTSFRPLKHRQRCTRPVSGRTGRTSLRRLQNLKRTPHLYPSARAPGQSLIAMCLRICAPHGDRAGTPEQPEDGHAVAYQRAWVLEVTWYRLPIAEGRSSPAKWEVKAPWCVWLCRHGDRSSTVEHWVVDSGTWGQHPSITPITAG